MGQHLSDTVSSLAPCLLTLPPLPGLGVEKRKDKAGPLGMEMKCIYLLRICVTHGSLVFLCV